MTQIEWLELANKKIKEAKKVVDTTYYPGSIRGEFESKLNSAITYINKAIELGKEVTDVKK